MSSNRWPAQSYPHQQGRMRKIFLPIPTTSVPMPNHAWSGYNYTPYQNSLHQNALRPGWSTASGSLPYHRDHPYGYANPYQRHGPTEMYPSSSGVSSAAMPSFPKGKRKYPTEWDRPKTTALNLRCETSSQKVFLIWDAFPGRKDIYYKIEAVCTSSACNFQSSGEGHQWSFEQTWTQTSKMLTTTPGNVYSITVEVRDLSTKDLVHKEEKDFKACMSLSEHESMYWKAAKFATNKMHPFQFLYRCKPKIYWDYIHRENYDLMEKYIKDNNGQPSNQINGNIHGLFFSARLQPDGSLPTSSPFGDVRMLLHGKIILDPEKHTFYFADFYCNYLTHYVTIVVCVKESETDVFCRKRCFPVNIYDNPFIKIARVWSNYERRYVENFFVCRDIWVEIYYTENVHLNWGRFSDIIATGAGTSKIGGLPNNKQCTVCNLYPVKVQTNDGLPDDALDVTILDDELLHNSTFRTLCEQDNTGLEEDWDDLVEVICSVIDGACEMQIEEKKVEEKSSDPIVQSNKEIAQLLKDTEDEIGSSVLLKVVPQLSEVWSAVKKHVDEFKDRLAKLQTSVVREDGEIFSDDTATEPSISQEIVECPPEEDRNQLPEPDVPSLENVPIRAAQSESVDSVSLPEIFPHEPVESSHECPIQNETANKNGADS